MRLVLSHKRFQMDIIRRNTDYAFRLIAELAKNQGQPISVRKLAEDNLVPYELARKLLQTLGNAEIVNSTKGPKGGYELKMDAAEISFAQIIEAIQGQVRLNQCLLSSFVCPMKDKCPISSHLSDLQKVIDYHLNDKKISDLL